MYTRVDFLYMYVDIHAWVGPTSSSQDVDECGHAPLTAEYLTSDTRRRNNMASVPRRSARGKNEASKTRDCVTAPRRKTRDTSELHDVTQSDTDALLKLIGEQACKIKTLTNEREKAHGDNATLRSELDRVKEELAVCKANTHQKIDTSHVIGKRKTRKKEKLDYHDCSDDERNPPVPVCVETKGETRRDKKGIGNQDEVVPKQGNDNFREIKEVIRAELQERDYQVREKKRRAANVIIHGLSEGKIIDNDRAQVEKIFKAVDVELNPKSFTRLGTASKSTKSRPLKLVMSSVNDKTLLMKNLTKLKNAEEELRKISITHDLTIAERKRSAAMVKNARAKEAINRIPGRSNSRGRVSSSPITETTATTNIQSTIKIPNINNTMKQKKAVENGHKTTTNAIRKSSS